MVHLVQPLFRVRERTLYQLIVAKQRASVLWLMSKAFNNNIPSDLREPYYRDHEDQDKLKPQIIHSLASAEYYCLALANIYADPNYHSLNHQGIVQVLMRKGIYITEPPDASLTETVLVQTAPIRMSAHMSVIEGLMALYIKEVLIPEKIVEVVRRFSPTLLPEEVPGDCEEAALFWINKSCIKLRHRIEEELGMCRTPEEPKASQAPRPRIPSVPILEDLADMSDGCCLGAVLSFYCPDYLCWQDICFNDPMSLADSLYNLQLVQQFCELKLPYNVCFLSLEDFLYVHSTIRPNLLAFVADLLYLFEIRPAKCVRRPGVKMEPEIPFSLEAPRRPNQNGDREPNLSSMKMRTFQHSWSPIPDLRSSGLGASTSSLPDINRISPRSNGTPMKERPLQRQLSAKHRSPQEGVRSPQTSTASLRRTNSATLTDTNKQYDTQEYGSTKLVPSEQRLHSDDDEELSRYLPSSQERLDGYKDSKSVASNPPSHVRRDLFLSSLKDGENSQESPFTNQRLKRINESGSDSRLHAMGGEGGLQGWQGQLSSTTLGDIPNPSPPPPQSHSSDSSVDSAKGFGTSRWAQPVTTHRGSIAEEGHPAARGGGVENGYLEDEAESSYSGGGGPYSLGSYDPHEADGLEPGTDTFSRRSSGLENYYNQLGSDLQSLHLSPRKEALKDQEDDVKAGQSGTTSFAQLSRHRGDSQGTSINIVYMHHDKETRGQEGAKRPLKSSFLQKNKDRDSEHRTTFAAVQPNTTTWQEQYGGRMTSPQPDSGHETPTESSDSPLAAQLYNVRLKLEERRRKIEQDKRRLELMWKKQRQRMGKVAFLQAVSKGSAGAGTPDSGTGKDDLLLETPSEPPTPPQVAAPPMERQPSLQEIEEELNSVKRKWLGSSQNGPSSAMSESQPDSELDDTLTLEQFETSIEELNTNLADLQADITRLSQQEMIQKMMEKGLQAAADPPETQQFFLHGQQQNQAQSQFHQPSPPKQQLTTSHPYPSEPSPCKQQQHLPQQVPYPPNHSPHKQLHMPQPMPSHYPLQPQQQPSLQHSYQQQQGYVPVSQAPPPPPQSVWGKPVTPQFAHQQEPPMPQPRRGQWGQPIIPQPGMLQQWQHPARPSSVEPHHALGLAPPYEQRPSSAVPFMAPPHMQGFSLHSQDNNRYTSYQYQPQMEHGMYQNGPLEGVSGGQYGFQQYPEPQPGQYVASSMGGPQTMQYQGMGFSAGPGSLPPMQQQMQHHHIQEPQHMEVPHYPESRVKDLSDPSASLCATEVQSSLVPGDFCRPTRPSAEQPAPSPNKPIMGRTFRVSKPKVLSPPTPEQESGFQATDASEHTPSEPTSSENTSDVSSSPVKGDGDNGKGFYISFGDSQPRKPKPRLRPKQVKAQQQMRRERQNQAADMQVPSPLESPSQLSGDRSSPPRMGQSETEKTLSSVREPERSREVSGVGFVIGADLVNPDPGESLRCRELSASLEQNWTATQHLRLCEDSENEMARRKEMIMLMSLRRRAEQEEQRLRKEQDYAKKREQERMKRELQERKKEEERQRRQAILEQYRQRKAQEEAEKEGLMAPAAGASGFGGAARDVFGSARTNTLAKPKHRSTSASRPRPKSVHVGLSSHESLPFASLDSHAGLSRNSHTNVAGTDYSDDTESLRNSNSSRSTSSGGGQAPFSKSHPLSPSSQAPANHPPSLPSSLLIGGKSGRGGPPSDGASDTGSTISSTIATEYTGPKLFVKPTAKSNRGIILNAINTVLAGAVNAETKRRVLEVINNSDSKHFLILFRDAGCQFRAIYSYNPEREEVLKMYGVGPKSVTDQMMDRFYKYNSGGKCFSQVQTKHLTVTIDAFTIHNNLWSGKKVVPPKKDFF